MIECTDLGLLGYNEAWKIQEDLRVKREKGEISDRLLLLEHPPVFTLGKRDCKDDIVSTRRAIVADGIDIVKTNRGGRITYHGPGQLVGYFICNVSGMLKHVCHSERSEESQSNHGILHSVQNDNRGVKRFVSFIEDLLIRVLSDFGIQGHRDPDHPGIWIGRNKIAAIGLHVGRGITQHGFALNVNCNLNHYRHIIACGIHDRGITSMETLLGNAPEMDQVKSCFKATVMQILSQNKC